MGHLLKQVTKSYINLNVGDVGDLTSLPAYILIVLHVGVSVIFVDRDKRSMNVLLLVSDTCADDGPPNLYLLQRWFPLILAISGGLSHRLKRLQWCHCITSNVVTCRLHMCGMCLPADCVVNASASVKLWKRWTLHRP